MFALNVSPATTSQLVFTDALLAEQPVDVYILSPATSGDVLSKLVDDFNDDIH